MTTASGWIPGAHQPLFDGPALIAGIRRFREPTHVVRQAPQGPIGIAFGGTVEPGAGEGQFLHLATLPPLYPEWLGDRAFNEAHNTRFPYVGGAMANGIASPQMVIALARQGMMGFLGTAGLSLEKMGEYIQVTARELAGTDLPWGANLIHSPQQPQLEMATVALFLEKGVTRVSASAFMRLTPAALRFAATGLHRRNDGTIGRRHHLFAKISRPEVAEQFMRPAPKKLLDPLVAKGHITSEEARLAAQVPVAQDLIVESDSGGHTDNRPLSALFPVIASLRDRLGAQYGYDRPVRLGAAGGLGTPQSVAAALSLGAAFVVTGSINQASVEAAQSPAVKELLAQAQFSDVVMAPAGDMFEMGVEVQVLKRGTLFASRAKKLYEIYSRYDSIDAIPQAARQKLESQIFQADMEEIWGKTREFFAAEDPEQIARAEADEKHRLALVCRWYLGLSSKWPLAGNEDRRMDYQVWMGPAQGAFNDWVAGSFLADPANRQVAQMGLNLLEGAAAITRAHQLRSYGAPVPPQAYQVRPRKLGV